jgi:hypothetical protein
VSEADGIDGLTRWLGLRWEAADRVRLTVRDELINPAGLLAGPAAYVIRRQAPAEITVDPVIGGKACISMPSGNRGPAGRREGGRPDALAGRL